MESFLPANYEAPVSSSGYTKLEKGSTKIRFMSSPLLGWIYWNRTEEKAHPVRVPYTQENFKEARKEANKNEKEADRKVKHFWACKVYNFDTKRIEIFEIVQKNIQDSLRAYSANEDWGNPINRYNIVIQKEGDGMETKYTVMPTPSAPSEEAEKASKETFVDLEALLYSEDPFDENWKENWNPTAE